MNLDEIKKSMRKFFNRLERKNLLPKKEKYEFRIKPNFDTACWTYKRLKGQIVNQIFIGDNAMATSNEFGSKERLLWNMLWHETGHSFYTTRDLEGISNKLNRINVPFSLWNIFEDCRIEHLIEKNYPHIFKWFDYRKPEYMGYGHGHPESILMVTYKNAGVITEDAKEAFVYDYIIRNSVDEHTEDLMADYAESIHKRVTEYYYPKIREADSSEELIPLLRKWKEEFTTDAEKAMDELVERLKELANDIASEMEKDGIKIYFSLNNDESPEHDSEDDSDEESNDSSGNHNEDCTNGLIIDMSDISLSNNLMEDDFNYLEFKEGSIKVIGNYEEEIFTSLTFGESESDKNFDFGGGGKGEDVEINTATIEDFTERNNLQDYPRCMYDRHKAKKLLPRFRRILEVKSKKIATTKPSKRFHTRNLVNDRNKIYKRKDEISKKKKTLSLVIDCSYSMRDVMTHMNVLVGVVNQLAVSNKINGNIILSHQRGFHSIKLPMRDEDIDLIQAFHGSEGLQRTFVNTVDLLKQSDHVFVLTDGDIGDEPVDKKLLRLKNVNPIGLYLGETKSLSQWFDRYVSRSTIEALVDELVRKIN